MQTAAQISHRKGENKMKKLFMVCNAHLDPVWLWNWQEGAAAAIATFRTAADICEESEGFVFCHNEALLYSWVEEYEPALFQRIRQLVEARKWHIMGGWYLQPDCNLPSGESILRQIIAGKRYFMEKFHAAPTVAVNFDTFGHSRGLVQILRKCGYTGYLFMRPGKELLELPSRNIRWRGFDGSEILAHRLDCSYGSAMGHAAQDAESWCRDEASESISLFTWGVGNHGGGPSRRDVAELDRWIHAQPQIQAVHSTPEAFFQALEDESVDAPVFADDLRPVFVGCYTAQARVKQLHRGLENHLFAAEKLLTAAAVQGLTAYPSAQLHEAEQDLLFAEFHDILPGTTIQECEADSIGVLQHGLTTVSRLQMKGAMALLAGQPKAVPEQTPVFLYNPHPYPITGDFVFELMPADQNWSQILRNAVTVTQNGTQIPSQEEKPAVNMNLDWRKRVAVHATLEPSGLTRLDCAFTQVPCTVQEDVTFPKEDIRFDNGDMQLTINIRTGLVDHYIAAGVEYVSNGAFAPVLYQDSPDPWYMEKNCFPQKLGVFALTEARRAHRYSDGEEILVPAVRIVENGAVRMLVEAEFVWGRSRLVQTYCLPKAGTSFEIMQDIFWNEADTMLKLEIPAAFKGDYLGQGMFGSGSLPQDGTECVSQKWCGLFGEKHALTICNSGIYGSHCVGSTISLSLLRASAYAAHPIGARPLVQEERFIPRMDQGEHHLHFSICGGDAGVRRKCVDMEAQVLNEAPFIFSAFPSGEGTMPKPMLLLSEPCVQLTAMYYDPQKESYVLRLWNSQPDAVTAVVRLPVWNTAQEVSLGAYQFQTYRIRTDGKLEPTPPI